ncbi:hypothetical protein Tco_0652793 [Tanacetum coccineum]|uniref:Uncharacterized protein n=1 Tax=Tanacetum coccineum TaxID=301880 RepID=A0ABQ4WYM9_9ASTR
MCRVDKFEVIKYSVGDNEEFLAFAHLNATVGLKSLTEYPVSTLISFAKRTKGGPYTAPSRSYAKEKDLAENRIDLMIYSEKCHVLNSHGHSEALINTLFAQTLKMENHPEQTIKGVNKARAVMSSASSAVTYTSVYTDSEPGRPVAPPSSDYIPDSEEPQTPPVPQDKDERGPMFIQPHDPDYVPEPIYPEYILLEDVHEFSVKEQPLPHALVDAVTAALPSPPLPPSLYIPPHVDRRDDVPESEQPPRKRSCLFALGSRYEVREISTARPTGGRGVDPAEAVPEIAPMIVGEDSRTRISQRVTMESQRVNLLMGDRMTLQETAVHYELQTHCEQMQQAEMAELRETDRKPQAQMIETLRMMRDMRQDMGDMQAELLALREQRRRARQPAPDARVLDHQDASRDADSHI